MSEQNGRLERVLALKDKIARLERNSHSQLLQPWVENLPRVRELLLGMDNDCEVPLKITLAFQALPGVIQGTLSHQDIGYVARYLGPDVDSILEQIENDLATESVPWQQDWQAQRKLKNALRNL